MNKKLVLIAAPPGCGKTYVANALCTELKNAVFLDKDDLKPLVDCAFELCGEEKDRDGTFYQNNIRNREYETIIELAVSALKYSDFAVVNAPFLSEVRDLRYLRLVKRKIAPLNAELVLIWVSASVSEVKLRLEKRSAVRDEKKLKDWNGYSSKIDFSVPKESVGAVDELIIFENGFESDFSAELKKTVGILTDNGETYAR